jgi:hypothetical protein
MSFKREEPLCSWSNGSWIYNQYLSPLKLWFVILNPTQTRCTWYNIMWYKVCQWLAAGRWFSLGTPVSSTNKTDTQYNWNIVESGVKHHNPNLIEIMEIQITYFTSFRGLEYGIFSLLDYWNRFFLKPSLFTLVHWELNWH